MFALEIGFKGDSPAAETIFIRRPTALIGARESAHVVIDDMAPLGYGILISRDVGRRFHLVPVGDEATSYTPQFLEGVYVGEAVIDLGPLVLRLTALDSDLLPKEGEAPDKAGIRVLRQACATTGPQFPAILLVSKPSATISFVPEQPLMIGRSRQCTLRVDMQSISSRHARIGFESGEFWVEDLGSTNGTFVNKQQISGRVNVPSGAPIALGRDVTLVGVLSPEDVSRALSAPEIEAAKPLFYEKRYPLLISVAETARPAQLMLTPGSSVVIGRDPSSDMWLGVPHISRRHCLVDVSLTGVVRITDSSTNGTSYDGGLLHKDQYTETPDRPLVMDFGEGVTVALCFSQAEEERFVATGGARHTFLESVEVADSLGGGAGARRPRKKSKTTFLRTPEEVRRVVGDVKKRGRLSELFLRLSGKGKLVMIAVVMALLALTCVVGGSLLSGLT